MRHTLILLATLFILACNDDDNIDLPACLIDTYQLMVENETGSLQEYEYENEVYYEVVYQPSYTRAGDIVNENCDSVCYYFGTLIDISNNCTQDYQTNKILVKQWYPK